MATELLGQVNKEFKDLDLNFTVHPVKKDINKHVGDRAIINSVKNLILTNNFERLFQPELGSNVRALLFENLDLITANALENEIDQVIKNYEPRASIKKLSVEPDPDKNAFKVRLEFFIVNRPEPVILTFFLERVR